MSKTVVTALPPQVAPPAFAFTDAAPSRVIGIGAVAIPVLREDDGLALGPGAAELADDLGIDLLDLADVAGASSDAGAVTVVPLTSPADMANPSLTRVLFVGVDDVSSGAVRRAGAALARHCAGTESVATSLHLVEDSDRLTAFVEGAVLGSFSFSMRTIDPPVRPVARIVLAGTTNPDEEVLRRALVLAGAGWRSRFLATVPSNIKNPGWLVDQVTSSAPGADLKVKVWDEKALTKEGFGGIAAVGRASVHPPRLVRLEHTPRKGARKAPHVVLVGKGITFDTGGLSIKPAEAMINMKRDMTGAAVVLAVMEALMALDCPVRVTGLLCLAENAIGGDAMRPGDVITHYDGRTSEVTNTDAEGRLVLADGLAYAVAELEPDVVVDVATLTGAAKVALGLNLGGVFSDSSSLAETLRAAGDAAGEPLWRLPLADVYTERLASKVADQNNAPGTAGAITAALFLKPFVKDVPWAHLDLAPVGDAAAEDFEWTTGPTGFGPRLLLRWLLNDPTKGIA